MKISGMIVTTLIEYAEVDVGDIKGVPYGEIPELFMKVAMTLSPRQVVAKNVQFCSINPSIPEVTPSVDAEHQPVSNGDRGGT